MSVPVGPFVLTLADITRPLRRTFEQGTDPRQGQNTRYTVVAAGLSAFSVVCRQRPSFLESPRRLEQAPGTRNAHTLLGVHQIPCDTPIRHLLAATPPGQVTPMFSYLFAGLNQAGGIDRDRAVNQTLLLALDGTEYFSSRAIHCPPGSSRHPSNSQVTQYHPARLPVLVKPGLDNGLPRAPAQVRPQDGAEKQDCELNAAKRGLARWGAAQGPLGGTLRGDDLYCHGPFCRDGLQQSMGCILVCTPDSHATVYEWVDFLQRRGAVRPVVRRRWTGHRRAIAPYRQAASIPLREGEDALRVNWCALTTTDEHGNGRAHHAFATSLPRTDRTVLEVVAAGRCRWKIENENHHPLKTTGYHFEHHYGHGQQPLALLLASLLLLAFLGHTVLEWRDDQEQLLCQKLPSRTRLFSDLRPLTSSLCFASWGALRTFMLQSVEPVPPPLEPG